MRHVLLFIAAIGLALTGCSPAEDAEASPASDAPAAVVGTPVRDGKLEFVVTSVDRSAVAGDPTNEFLQETAKGEFVNVHLKVTNIGDEARMFSSSSQKLIVGGSKYDAASILGVPGDNENINPGLSVETVVSFDVAPGAVPDAVELHDSMLSGGATVNLR